MFVGISPFLLGFLVCWHIIFHNVLLQSYVFLIFSLTAFKIYLYHYFLPFYDLLWTFDGITEFPKTFFFSFFCSV